MRFALAENKFMKEHQTIHVKITKSQGWYKLDDIHEVYNYVNFSYVGGEAHFETIEPLGGIKFSHCIILKPSEVPVIKSMDLLKLKNNKVEFIKKGNEIIGTFMNLDWSIMKTASNPEGFPVLFDSENHQGYTNLKFHSSFNELMQACKKWDDLDNVLSKHRHKYEELCDLLDNKVTLYEVYPVFEQLVENINWYNENCK